MQVSWMVGFLDWHSAIWSLRGASCSGSVDVESLQVKAIIKIRTESPMTIDVLSD